ncbi:hypothetical protein IWW51_002989, partial [Coemansia sp. RSA 2702]
MKCLLLPLLFLGQLTGLCAAKHIASGMEGLEGHVPHRREIARFMRNPVQANNFTDDESLQRLRAHRAEDVRKGFVHAWRAYKKYAFGSDEINPLTLEPLTT